MDKTTLWLIRFAAGIFIISAAAIPFYQRIKVKRQNDLLVNTDLGEKFTISETALTSFKFTKSDLLNLYQEEKRFVVQELKRLEEIRNRNLEGCQKFRRKKTRNYCLDVYSSGVKFTIKNDPYEIKIYRPGLENLNNQISIIENEKEKTLYVGLKYRTIFEDINGDRSARGYEKVACLNPNISSKLIKLIDRKKRVIYELNKLDQELSEGYVVPTFDSTALDILKQDACKKYAEFQWNAYNYQKNKKH